MGEEPLVTCFPTLVALNLNTRLEKAFEGNRPEAIWSLRFRDLTDVETEQFIQMQQLLSNTYEFLRRC